MKIESKKEIVTAPIDNCFEFLLNMNNYELLLPKDKITNWESDEKQCSFKVQNTYKLGLVYESSQTNRYVNIKSSDKSPFKFDLQIQLSEISSGVEIMLVCNASINPFLKMMVQKPLKNLFDYMTERMNIAIPKD